MEGLRLHDRRIEALNAEVATLREENRELRRRDEEQRRKDEEHDARIARLERLLERQEARVRTRT